jgi:hypothetical protein
LLGDLCKSAELCIRRGCPSEGIGNIPRVFFWQQKTQSFTLW